MGKQDGRYERLYLRFFQHEVRALGSHRMQMSLADGHDVNAIMSAMTQNINKATRSLDDWLKLDKFLRVAISVAAAARDHYAVGGTLVPGTPLAVRKLLRSCDGIHDLYGLISAVIDLQGGGGGGGGRGGGGFTLHQHDVSEAMSHSYVGLVKPGVCKELDDMRLLYHGLPDLLTRVQRIESARIPRVLQGRGVENRMSVVYLPKVGYALRLEDSTLPPDIAEELPDFEFAFDQVRRASYYLSYCHTTRRSL